MVNPARLASTVTAVSACCGSHTSFGTVVESFIERASAQSLANVMVYFVRSGDEEPASIVTARTTRFAFTPVDTASTASTSPGQMSCGVCRLNPVYLPDQAAARLVANASMANAAFSQSAELRADGPDHAASPGRGAGNRRIPLCRNAGGAGQPRHRTVNGAICNRDGFI